MENLFLSVQSLIIPQCQRSDYYRKFYYRKAVYWSRKRTLASGHFHAHLLFLRSARCKMFGMLEMLGEICVEIACCYLVLFSCFLFCARYLVRTILRFFVYLTDVCMPSTL